jgi:hypothetical protein
VSLTKLIKPYQSAACFSSALNKQKLSMTCLSVEKMIMIDLFLVGHNSLFFHDYSFFYAVDFTRTKFMDSLMSCFDCSFESYFTFRPVQQVGALPEVIQ